MNFLDRFLEKYANIKFHGNSSAGSQVATYRWTDRLTDKMKLTVAFQNFALPLDKRQALLNMVMKLQVNICQNLLTN
jgi:hypothetical protein